MIDTPQSGYLIRDALKQDIPACLQIDHTYTSEYVWQMTIQKQAQQTSITFRQERLPRELESEHVAQETRLQNALEPQQCFIVVVTRSNEILGYITMFSDQTQATAMIQDIVVDRPYRQHRIGKKLLQIARQWAYEHEHQQLRVATQTKNYPAIQFFQSNGLVFCGYDDQYYMNQEIAIFWGQALR